MIRKMLLIKLDARKRLHNALWVSLYIVFLIIDKWIYPPARYFEKNKALKKSRIFSTRNDFKCQHKCIY